MDYKKCCELLKPLYGKNNDYGLFREDLTEAEKSNLERNLDGGACFGKLSGWLPWSDHDFYTPNETAFRNALIREGENGKSAMIKPWEQLTKDQQQHVVNYCNQLYQNASSEETYVADQIMMTTNPTYEQSFANEEPQLDQEIKLTGAGTGAVAGAVAGAVGGVKLGLVGGLPGIAACGIAGATAGAIGGFKLQNGGNFTYTDKRGPTLLKQVQNELDGKTLQRQQENINTQSRQQEWEPIKINEEQRQKDEERRKNEERKKEEEQLRKEQLKEERQQRKEQLEEEKRQKKEQLEEEKRQRKEQLEEEKRQKEDQLEEEKRQRKEQLEEEKRQKEDQKKKEKQQKEDSTQTKDIRLKDIDFSQKDTNQPVTVKRKKGQVTTQPANLQNLNQNLDAIRQKITEETQNSTNAPATVDASQLDNNKSLQAAIAAKEQGSWWSRNWDILALIAGGLGALGLGFWLVKRQKNKTKEAQAEASTLANQVSSLNSKVSSLTEALNTQSNQPATNTGTNTDSNTNTGTNTDTNTNTGTGTGNGSTLENSGSSVPNDSSTDSSSVDKGRPVKIVIKGKTSSEME